MSVPAPDAGLDVASSLLGTSLLGSVFDDGLRSLFPRLFAQQQQPDSNKKKDSKSNSDLSQLYEQMLLDLLSQNSLEQIIRRPALLSDQRRQIRSDMESLAFNNYRVFIQTANTASAVHNEMKSAGGRLDSAAKHLPELATACQEFTKSAANIAKTRQQQIKTLKQHASLLDILEIPQLMDTCVKNYHYDEALELEQYARRLASQHPDIPIVRDLLEDVQYSTLIMQMQLHQQLCGNIQLPACLRIIGYLKRLNVYSDRELRVVFLQCRSAYLNELISQIPTANVYAWLNKFVESSRSQLFDVITQYRAIFDYSSDAADSSSAAADSAAAAAAARDDGGILYGWVSQKIAEFIQKLDKSLGELSDGSSLANILNQCMYFGLSLGRNGVDLRSLLSPVFDRAILNLYKYNLLQAQQQFSAQLKKYKLFPIQQTVNTPALATPSKSRDLLSPPLLLLDFPPAAALCNGVLTALNELRKCCPQSLQFTVAKQFESIFVAIIQQLRTFSRETPLSADEKVAVQELAKVICEELIPFLVRCYDTLFKSSRRLIAQEKLQALMSDLFDRRVVQNTIAELLNASEQAQVTPASVSAPAPLPVAADDRNSPSPAPPAIDPEAAGSSLTDNAKSV